MEKDSSNRIGCYIELALANKKGKEEEEKVDRLKSHIARAHFDQFNL